MDKRTCKTEIVAAYRRSDLKIICGLYTVSTDAALLIAWTIPRRLAIKYKLVDQEETLPAELSRNTVANRPWMP